MQNTVSRLVIRESASKEVLVDADPAQFRQIEGNWYVDPSAVNLDHLTMTTHAYECPYKGRCFYVDFDDGKRKAQRVAWVYDEVKAGWEHIRGRYGFYAGSTARRIGKTSDAVS